MQDELGLPQVTDLFYFKEHKNSPWELDSLDAGNREVHADSVIGPCCPTMAELLTWLLELRLTRLKLECTKGTWTAESIDRSRRAYGEGRTALTAVYNLIVCRWEAKKG